MQFIKLTESIWVQVLRRRLKCRSGAASIFHEKLKASRVLQLKWVPQQQRNGHREGEQWCLCYLFLLCRFQEVVPLSTGNVLCVEDEAPVTIWEGLIRNTLNNKIKFHKEPLKSFSAPPSPWHEDDITSDVPEVSSLRGLLDTVVNEEVLNTSLLTPEQNLPNSNKTLSNCQHDSSDTQLLTKSGPDDLEDTLQSFSKKVTTAEDWLAEAATADDFTEETPLVAHSSQLIDYSCNYCRVASKQMVGVLITIWVRSELRRHVHNIKVCGIQCGIFNFLGNKVGY